jgi:aspartyl-tRNA synthetase
LRAGDIGGEVTLNGWANSVRDHGDLVFIDLRDRTGIVQLRVDRSECGDLVDLAAQTKSEFVLTVTGKVRARGEADVNPNIETGEIEVNIERLEVLNTCKQPLPFQLWNEAQMATVNEELRLKHRYLDLRRPSMYKMLELRHKAVTLIRDYMNRHDFLEVETPIITKETPEGARDYLVPYRLQPGLFYALPQSPQQYKQLLMVAGIERYYQIAKCFRDEAQRADRQPEFTQLDLEMSFVTQEDVLQLVEGLVVELIDTLGVKKLGGKPFTRLSYDDALRLYGTDKPDLRFGLELLDLGEALKATEFSVFRGTLDGGGQVKAVRYPGGASLSRKEIDDLTAFAREFGAKGLAYILVDEGGATRGPVAKYLSETELAEVLRLTEAQAGDLIGFIADSPKTTANVLGRLRNEIGRRLKLADPDVLHFAWVLDFPLVDWSEEEKRWDPSHHPFTMPHPADLEFLESDPARVRAQCYDLVVNGTEWASGSIRIHRRDIQERVFDLIGVTKEQQEERFAHILNAFEYGAPPHGGIAPGIDRLIMMMLGTENIREVMAFPKIGAGIDPMMDAPAPVGERVWKDLGLSVTPVKKV